ncbi:uncharacterized protein ACA1_134760, partial [Acanthamoeba castellanii str. Neff]
MESLLGAYGTGEEEDEMGLPAGAMDQYRLLFQQHQRGANVCYYPEVGPDPCVGPGVKRKWTGAAEALPEPPSSSLRPYEAKRTRRREAIFVFISVFDIYRPFLYVAATRPNPATVFFNFCFVYVYVVVVPRLPSTLFNRTRRPQKSAATETRLVQRITHRFSGLHTAPVNTCR